MSAKFEKHFIARALPFLVLTLLASLAGAQDEAAAPPAPDAGPEAAPDAGAPPEATPPPPAPDPAQPVDPSVAKAEAEKKEKERKEKEELKKRCAKLEKKGEPLPSECKTLDLEVVFQGAVGGRQKSHKPVAQAKDSESESIKRKEEENKIHAERIELEEKRTLWDVARAEPKLFPEKEKGYFAVAGAISYPSIKERGASLESAYAPVIDVSAEIRYQVLRMMHVALVADFQALKGQSVATTEIIARDEYTDDSNFIRENRDIGAFMNSFIGIGVRPTVRLDFEWRRFQLITGVGMGWHLMHTSGKWRAKLAAEDRANDDFYQANWNGDDEAMYEFDLTDSGLYAVFEAAILYRLMEERLGVGILIKYNTLLHGALEPDVTVTQDYGIESSTVYPESWEGYTARENDYGDTFIRHLGAMSLLSVGLMADWRF